VRLQNGTRREKGGTADQSTHGKLGLGTVCKEETSEMRNVLIENFEGKNYIFGFEENCIHRIIIKYLQAKGKTYILEFVVKLHH
jgi:hypothetical protein